LLEENITLLHALLKVKSIVGEETMKVNVLRVIFTELIERGRHWKSKKE
jgi:hypothetical protein